MPSETFTAEVRTLRDAIEAKRKTLPPQDRVGRDALFYEERLLRQKLSELHAARCQEQTERFAQRLSLAALNQLSPLASVTAAVARAKPAPAKETR